MEHNAKLCIAYFIYFSLFHSRLLNFNPPNVLTSNVDACCFAFVKVFLLVLCIDKQVLPKLFGKIRVATPHGRERTRPLRVLAVQSPLQTSPITQPRV